jgi:hypothetical protein
LCLTTAKTILTLDFKDGRNQYSGSFHDLMIRIEKAPSQAFRQLPSDGSLACAHQAHKIDIFTIFHSWILSDYHHLTKKAGDAGLEDHC